MGLSYLRSQMSVFTSLSVKEHKKLANTKNQLFNGSLNRDSKGSFLSGGEKQKLSVDILPEADVYLLDEPTIGLDREATKRLSASIEKMVNTGKSILVAIPELREFSNN